MILQRASVGKLINLIENIVKMFGLSKTFLWITGCRRSFVNDIFGNKNNVKLNIVATWLIIIILNAFIPFLGL